MALFLLACYTLFKETDSFELKRLDEGEYARTVPFEAVFCGLKSSLKFRL